MQGAINLQSSLINHQHLQNPVPCPKLTSQKKRGFSQGAKKMSQCEKSVTDFE